MTPEEKEHINEELDRLSDQVYASAPEAMIEISKSLGNFGISFPLSLDLEDEMIYGVQEAEGQEKFDEYLYIYFDANDISGLDLFVTILNEKELDYLDSSEDSEDDPFMVISRRRKNRKVDLTGGNTNEY